MYIYIDYIGSLAFCNCYSLSQIYVPSNCKYIGMNAFTSTNISTLTLYGEVGNLYDCPNLRELNIYGINKQEAISLIISDCMKLEILYFIDCSYRLELNGLKSLNQILMLNSTINLNSYASSSNDLQQILLYQYSYLTIDRIIFETLASCLRTIESDETSFIDTIYTNTFINLPNISFKCNVKNSIQTKAFINVDILEITITAKRIESYAFYQCHNLKYVRISSHVEELCEHFIENCENFESIEFLDVNNTDTNLTFAPNLFWKITTFNLNSDLPQRLQIIGAKAFCGCTGLTGSLILPKSLTMIGDSAFEGCYNLNGFLRFECDELTTIGNSAFLGCSNLCGSLELPDSLREIGEYCFTNCAFQGPLIIPRNVYVINSHAFSMCKSFTGSLTIGENVVEIGEYAFAECTGLNGQLNIHSTKIKEIKNNAFFSCTQLQGSLICLETCKSLSTIGSFAFFNCYSLTNTLKLPDSISYIGDSAFAYCYGISGVLTIPNNISYIGENAFYQCTNITKIYFQEPFVNNFYVGTKAFGNMKISCLSNVPSVCSISNSTNLVGYDTSGHSRCYDSSEFDGLALFFNLQENCSAKEAVETIQWILIALLSAGFIGIFREIFMYWYKNLYTIRRKVSSIFKDVVLLIKAEFVKQGDCDSVSRFGIEKIQQVMAYEIKNPSFHLSKETLKDLLDNSFKKNWRSVPYIIQLNILNECFENYDYNMHAQEYSKKKLRSCICVRCFYKKNRNNEEFSTIDESNSAFTSSLI